MQPLSSATVTVKLQLPISPCELVAVQITVVTPTGKACGEVIGLPPAVQVGVSAPSHWSVAVTVKLLVAVVWPGSVFVDMLAGQVTVGAMPAPDSKAPISTCVQVLRGKPSPR